MKFAFVAKHRGIWPAEWLCGALGVSRGGFYAWLTRPRSQRSRRDEDLVQRFVPVSSPAIGPMAPRGCGTTCWRKACRVDCIGSSV